MSLLIEISLGAVAATSILAAYIVKKTKKKQAKVVNSNKPQLDPEKLETIIGPGEKTIRTIQEETSSKILIEGDGRVNISGDSKVNVDAAIEMVNNIVEEPKKGKVYSGTVTKITDFGAFVELLAGKEGLVHISEISHDKVEKVEDYLKVDQIVDVMVIEINSNGKIKLSIKALDTK